jgi:hypothetical protein
MWPDTMTANLKLPEELYCNFQKFGVFAHKLGLVILYCYSTGVFRCNGVLICCNVIS